MKLFLIVAWLFLLITRTSCQGEFDLFDALDDEDKPTDKPKTTKKPSLPGEFDLSDALKPDSNPVKPTEKPRSGGGGGRSFDDSDLSDVSNSGYKPEGGGSSGGRAADSGYDSTGGGADQPQGAGSIAGIASAIGVALLGAASSYFAYQKKKLCFKLQGGADPESGKAQQGNQNDPQLFSNLLQSSN